LAEDLDAAMAATETSVAFVSGNEVGTRLEIAPLDVGPTLANRVWGSTIGVLASATIPATLAQRVGLSMVQQPVDVMDVGSPFDYEQQSLLYCALQLPDVRSPEFAAASHAELIALIQAAGGRTLSLFTSWKAMDAAAEAVRAQVPYRVFTQRDLPKPALIREFSRDETSCLFATAGFFQGVDIPGRTLTLVTIDRLPFPRPDDPLLSARREQLGAAAFRVIDVPRAATLLAQAAGRLIRTRNDRGVVAVLDRRLGTANYRWDLIKALPPMRRTRHRADAETFLAQVASH
jgi:ATP-dependent DNA helicase DinG